MNLKDFIAQSIKEILEGVTEAQKFAHEVGAVVNPSRGSDWSGSTPNLYKDKRTIRQLDFEVVVTVTGDTEKSLGGEAGGKIEVVSASIGGKWKWTTQKVESNRLKFSVPYVLPDGETEKGD